MKKFKEIWNKVNSKVDVLFWGIIILIALNLFYGYQLSSIESSTIKPTVVIPRSRPYESNEDTGPEEQVDYELPIEYQQIVDRNMFKNPDLLKKSGPLPVDLGIEFPETPVDSEDTSDIKRTIVVQKEREKITGYVLTGVVFDEIGKKGAALIETPTSEHKKVREGEKVGSRVTLKKVMPGRALLTAPGYLDTWIYLDREHILNYWKNAKPDEFKSNGF